VGFIDSERIFNEYKGVQEAQKQFDQDIQTWKAQATGMKSSVDKLRLEVESQRLMLSDGKLQEKESAREDSRPSITRAADMGPGRAGAE
jgi:regulator of replication initiation timing